MSRVKNVLENFPDQYPYSSCSAKKNEPEFESRHQHGIRKRRTQKKINKKKRKKESDARTKMAPGWEW